MTWSTGSKTNQNRAATFPIDCPTCPLFTDNNEADCARDKARPKKNDESLIEGHIESLKSELPQYNMDIKLHMCLIKKESSFRSSAANCESTARGIGQVLKGTAKGVLQQGACKGKGGGLDWAKSSRSTKFQVFLSMCVLVEKARGGKIGSKALERYYGSKSPAKNRAYANSIKKCANKGA